MPSLQTDTAVFTFADAVEHLLDLHEIDRQAALNQRNARRAIQSAYGDLPQKHCWSYYFRQRLLQTAASYSTGTVEYDHTGGSNERQLTLTTGTWPDWAAFGRVIISSVHYEVESRISDTVLTLRTDSNPGADVAASTTYTIYRNAYPLPVNFRRMGHVWDVTQQRSLPYVDPQEQHDSNVRFFDTPDTPWQFTLRNTGDYLGSMQIVFGPPPSAVKSYDILHEVTPRPLRIDSYSTGTVAVTSTNTATLTGGTWPEDCVGSILRLASDANVPTGVTGGFSSTGAGLDNRFASQHVIKSRTSSTVVVLEDATSNVSGKGFMLSDPIDIEAGAMLRAFLRMAEAEFCFAAGRDDATKRYQRAQMAIVEAIEGDTRAPRTNGVNYYDPFRHVRVTDG